jgi:hypothetical protein
MEKTFDRAGKSGLFFVGAKGFGQAADFDGGHWKSFEFLILNF